jgi:hypothetical protein
VLFEKTASEETSESIPQNPKFYAIIFGKKKYYTELLVLDKSIVQRKNKDKKKIFERNKTTITQKRKYSALKIVIYSINVHCIIYFKFK